MNPCLFCKIAAGDIPATKLYEDDLVVAFLDIAPLNPGHALVIPKSHHFAASDLPEATAGRLLGVAGRLGAALMRVVDADGFNLLLANGAAAGQVIPHAHLHVIPRFPADGIQLPSRTRPYADAAARDELAAKIRERLAKPEGGPAA
ncbi:MAG: HIT family protein [Lentisphaeria bacterium]|jgi:histidine triad (HIT) family protein